MIFGRTFDMEVVRAILTHPKIYPFIGDDDAPKMEEFRPREDPGIWYVLARLTPDSSEPLGMFVLVAQSRTCWDIHVNILPSTYGPVAWLVSQEIFPWIWESTTARRVVGSVPAYNKLAIHYAERAGMKRFGINEKSYLKGGVLIDQVLLGISKPE
jgi:RimJ/RimL family protein N-acetyltransferase